MTKLMTIVIPTYNTEIEYFERCITSIDPLANESIEVVVVDDGSEASHCCRLERVALSSCCDVRFYSKLNGGQNSARQYGIDHAEGQYILFLDSDDYLDSLELRKVLSCIRTNRPDILYFNYDVVDVDGKIINHHDRWQSSYSDIDVRKGILFSNSLSFSVYRVAALKELDFELVQGIRIGEDLSSAMSILIKVGNAYSLGVFPYKYVKRSSSITRMPSKNVIYDIQLAFDELIMRAGSSIEGVHEEVEWMAILHVLAWGGLRAVRCTNASSTVKDSFFNWIEARFPEWRDNKYLKEDPIAKTIWFRQLINGNWRLLSTIMHVYDSFKRVRATIKGR